MKLLMSVGIFYPSQVGGPGNTLYWLGKELALRGVQTTAVVMDRGVAEDFAPRNQWIDLCGIRIKYCKHNSSIGFMQLLWNTLIEIPSSDVVILSSIFYKPNFFVGLVALVYRKKIIWSPRGELLFKRDFIKRKFLWLLKFLFARRIIFHATSLEEESSIKRCMGDKAKCIVIPNYMELPSKIEVKSDEKYLLYVGRIMPIKALEKLIEGVSKSKLFADQGYKLYLAGQNEGEYYENLVSLIRKLELEDRVVFKGMVEGRDKESLYAAAKALMLVSHTENFGNVVIESLAHGTPAITSHGTPWQILEKTRTGYWIENSPENIGATIDKLLSLDAVEYKQMRSRAYKFCCEEFDIKTNINKWQAHVQG